MAYDTANCYVCSKKLKPEDIKYFKEAILELLDVIFTAESIKNLTEITNPVICKSCSDKIYDSFNFKSKCIDNEDMLVPYIKELGPKLNLKDVCCKEGLFREKDLSDNITICRLCLNINSEKKHLDKALNKNELHDVIENNFSEINVKLLKESYICEKCIENLKKYKCLIEIFSKTIKKTTQPSEGVKEDRKAASPIEQKDNAHTNKSMESDTNDIKNEENKIKTSRYKCGQCDFKSIYQSSYRRHSIIHKRPATTECQECPKKFEKVCLLGGTEKEHSHNAKKFNCKICNYTTNRQGNFWYHSLTHKTDEECVLYECAKCSYKSKYKGDLKRHILVHGIARHKCPQCEFRTRQKNSLRRHIISKHVDNAVLYSCDQCSFSTKSKYNLKGHRINMHDSEKVQI